MKTYEEMARDLLARRDAHEQQQKRKKKRRKRVILCATSSALLVLSGFGIWKSGILQQDFDNVPIAEVEMKEEIDRSQMQQEKSPTKEKRERKTENKKKRKDNSIKEVTPSPYAGSSSEDRVYDDSSEKIGALNVPCNIVWNNGLYEVQEDTTLNTLKESDLGKEYHKTLNGVTVTVYSLKNIPMEESIAYKRNNRIFQYNCIYNQVFNVNGKEYGLVDWMYYRYPEPKKGEYLGEVNNKKIYKFVGNDKVVLVDMTSSIGVADDEEYLFVAKLLE